MDPKTYSENKWLLSAPINLLPFLKGSELIPLLEKEHQQRKNIKHADIKELIVNYKLLEKQVADPRISLLEKENLEMKQWITHVQNQMLKK